MNMDEDQVSRFAIMEKSIEFIRESIVKIDEKLDYHIEHVDNRFKEVETKSRNAFAGKYIERLFWVVIPVIISLAGALMLNLIFNT